MSGEERLEAEVQINKFYCPKNVQHKIKAFSNINVFFFNVRHCLHSQEFVSFINFLSFHRLSSSPLDLVSRLSKGSSAPVPGRYLCKDFQSGEYQVYIIIMSLSPLLGAI